MNRYIARARHAGRIINSGLLACALGITVARAEWIEPTQRAVSLQEVRQADVIMLVRVSEAVEQPWEVVAPLQYAPMRDKVYGVGNRIKGRVLKVYKGDAESIGRRVDYAGDGTDIYREVNYPLGAEAFSAKAGDEFILFIRDAAGKPWISRIASPRAAAGSSKLKRTKETKGGSRDAVADKLVGYRITLAHQALSKPTREAAEAWLRSERDAFIAKVANLDAEPSMGPDARAFLGVMDGLLQEISLPEETHIEPTSLSPEPAPGKQGISDAFDAIVSRSHAAAGSPGSAAQKRMIEQRRYKSSHMQRMARIVTKFGDDAMVRKLWEILQAEGTRTYSGSPIERAFSFSRRPFVQQKLRETWNSSKGTTLDIVAFNNFVYASDATDEEKIAFACEAVKDPARHASMRNFAAQYIARQGTTDTAVGDAMYAAMKAASFTNKYLKKGVALKDLPMKMRVMTCEVSMLPQCFAGVMVSTKHQRGIDWILEFENRIEPWYVPLNLAALDPELRDRRVLERVARRACLERDPGGSYLGRQERECLDRVFGRLFQPAANDEAELQAWLAAFDAGTLDRSGANHWMWDLPAQGWLVDRQDGE